MALLLRNLKQYIRFYPSVWRGSRINLNQDYRKSTDSFKNEIQIHLHKKKQILQLQWSSKYQLHAMAHGTARRTLYSHLDTIR